MKHTTHFCKQYLRPVPLMMGLFLTGAAAIGQVDLKGKVTDDHHSPIGYVNIELKGTGGAAMHSVTDSLGHYSFQHLEARGYSLVASFLNSTQTLPVVLTTDTSIDIVFDLSDKSLAAATVSGRKPLVERKVDRLVFNVDNSVAAVGGDALDVLKVTPDVKVTDDKLAIIGKSSVKVMVNGKLLQITGDNLIAYLRSLPASSIQSIEVITAPPARYEAEGNSGLVNIVLKQARQDSWNASVRGSLTQNSVLGYTDGARFDFQKGKLSFFADAGDADYRRTNSFHNEIFYPGQTWISNRSMPSDFRSNYARVGADYAVTPMWSVGGQYEGDFSRQTVNATSATTVYGAGQQVDSLIQSQGNTHSRNNGNAYNVHSILKLDSSGKRVSVDLDYYTNDGSTSGYMAGTNLLPSKAPISNSAFTYSNGNASSLRNYSAGVDFDWPTRWATLSFGGKVSANTVDNNYVFSSTGAMPDTNQDNLFRYQEDKQALYFSGSRKIGSKIEFQAGLRVENTRTQGYSRDSDSTFVNRYLKFFPTGYLTYHLNGNSSLSATYSKRLERPGFELLDPYEIYINSQTTSRGNPYLQPSYTDNLELIYNYGNNETKLYYSNTDQGFSQIGYINAAGNTTNYTYENFLTLKVYGIEQSYTFNKVRWWTSTNSVDLNYSVNRSSDPSTVQQAQLFSGYFSTSNDFTVNRKKNVFFNVGYWYNLPQVNGVAWTSGMGSLSSSLKVLLFNKKVTVGLSGNDLLRTQLATMKLSSNGIQAQYRNYFDARQVRLSVSYKFGNKNISVKKRDFGNQEDRSRSGN